jgi:hypothetical protein
VAGRAGPRASALGCPTLRPRLRATSRGTTERLPAGCSAHDDIRHTRAVDHRSMPVERAVPEDTIYVTAQISRGPTTYPRIDGERSRFGDPVPGVLHHTSQPSQQPDRADHLDSRVGGEANESDASGQDPCTYGDDYIHNVPPTVRRLEPRRPGRPRHQPRTTHRGGNQRMVERLISELQPIVST